MALLHQLFNSDEVRLITSIALSAFGTKDRLIWKQTANGQYDVSSGYKLANKLKRQRFGCEGTSNSVEAEKVIWKSVWGLNVKKKIHHFL